MESVTPVVQIHEEAVEPQPSEVIVEVLPPVVAVNKKKRPRSEGQIKALEHARKNKVAKKKTLKKPVKIERHIEASDSADSFSWSKEVAKVSCLAALGLASVYVQQQFAQSQKEVVAVSVETKPTSESPPPKPRQATSGDPFSGYR
jgi:hypothetical protein